MTRPGDTTGDELLMLRTAGGDLRAFDEIVHRHQRTVWNAACRFTGDAVEAEDLAQEAFLRALSAAPRYRPSGSLRNYLLRIVGRLCLDWARKKRPAYTDRLPEAPDDAPSQAVVYEANQRAARVRTALQDLAPNQRLAITLKYYEGQSHAEIAAVIGVTEKAVERLLARAREKLRKHLPRGGD